jgi:hypothetical protein
MNSRPSLKLLCFAVLLAAAVAPVAAAEPARVQREIIPGSELMTTQEREQYRLRLRGAGTAAERERLRAEHVKAMEQRARLQGLRVSDPSREREGRK